MFLFTGRVSLCLGYVLTQLLYVTELNNLLHCAIGDRFVNDRLDTSWRSLELDETTALTIRVKPETAEWLLENIRCSLNSSSALSLRWQTVCLW